MWINFAVTTCCGAMRDLTFEVTLVVYFGRRRYELAYELAETHQEHLSVSIRSVTALEKRIAVMQFVYTRKCGLGTDSSAYNPQSPVKSTSISTTSNSSRSRTRRSGPSKGSGNGNSNGKSSGEDDQDGGSTNTVIQSTNHSASIVSTSHSTKTSQSSVSTLLQNTGPTQSSEATKTRVKTTNSAPSSTQDDPSPNSTGLVPLQSTATSSGNLQSPKLASRSPSTGTIVVAILGGIVVLAILVTLWLRASQKGIRAIEAASSSRSEIAQWQELQSQRLSQAVAQIQTLEQQLRTLREENAAQAADISPPSYSPSQGLLP
ncbi:hypothetical protein C8J56DRAFT_890724 [Mycena floridula]|nr:hypothetical protein C8J56DRAFT_890724 [Mycena floridula]